MKPLSMAQNLLLASVIVMAGCAGGPIPLNTDKSTAAIRAAEELGAANVPKASLHLQLAKDELQKAKEFAEKGKKEKAEAMLSRAEVDAELSYTLAKEQEARTQTEQATQKLRQIEQEMKSQEKGGSP